MDTKRTLEYDILPFHTSNDNVEKYTGKYVELILQQAASVETAQFITKHENYLLSH